MPRILSRVRSEMLAEFLMFAKTLIFNFFLNSFRNRKTQSQIHGLILKKSQQQASEYLRNIKKIFHRFGCFVVNSWHSRKLVHTKIQKNVDVNVNPREFLKKFIREK